MAGLRGAGHAVSLLAPSAAGGVLAGAGPGEVDRVLAWESAGMATLLAGEGDVAPEVRRSMSGFDAVIAYTGNEDLVCGLGSGGARVIAHPPVPPPDLHAARWLAQPVGQLGGDPEVPPPVMIPSTAETAAARPWLERLPAGFLALHPGSGSGRKNWPPERFLALVDRLSPDRPWLLVEGPADGEAVRPLAGHPLAVPACEVGLRVLGAVLGRARLYVGNDSGVTHLAAAFGAPTLALFGPTDPAQWAPVGPRVAVVASSDGRMETIEIDRVAAAARAVLPRSSRARRDEQT